MQAVAMVDCFNVKIELKRNYTLEDAEFAINLIYKKHGKQMAIIIEKMYRSETAHFESLQYKQTGTGGMESFGLPLYYGWEWFGFKQITETSSLKEFYLSAKKATTRNKDNASLENYKPTLKETLTILDKQYIQNSNKYATLTQGCFKGISEKPHLTTVLGWLLVNYQSEWYEKLDAEGKRPEWEALNSEMTDDAENYLGYIKDGNEAKRDAYVSKHDESKQESIKQGLEQQRRDYQRFPPDYKDAPDKKLTQEQLKLLGYINQLEEKYKLWEKTKEKATKMLWWDDVAKGLAKQSQQTEQSDAETQKEQLADISTNQTQTSSTLATLSQNGRVWFIHPLSLVTVFYVQPITACIKYSQITFGWFLLLFVN